MDAHSMTVLIILWIAAIPSGLKYYNLLKAPKDDEIKLKKAKKSFIWSLFFAVIGTLAVILEI